MLSHLLEEGTPLEKTLGRFLGQLVTIQGRHVNVPDYCNILLNEISLNYCTINGFLQLPTSHTRNLFQFISTVQSNPQQNVPLISELVDIAPFLGSVLRMMPPEHVSVYQELLRHLYSLYISTIGTENWFEESCVVPPSSHRKFVLTGRDQVRQPRNYVQSEAEAEREMKGVGDCKKIPTSTQHHSNLFVGCCNHGICLIACPMSYSESPRFVFNLLLEYYEKPPQCVLYDNACHAHEFALNREPCFF